MRNLFYDNSLELEIYTIGYKNEGECILFFIKTDSKVAYTGLVDCYINDSIDIVSKLLNMNKIYTLDFVCWTHPHDDHTKGLQKIITELCNQNTKFWSTDIIPEDLSLYSKDSGRMFDALKEIHLSNNKNKMVVKYAKDSTIMERLFCSGLQQYLFEIKSFAPNSTLLAERTVENKDEKGNLYSIGLIINFGRYYVMLAGDVENKTFKALEDYEIEYPVDYIKIPHHGSPSASYLIDKMDNLGIHSPNIAVSTAYKKGKIPKKSILDKYKIWGTSHVICSENFIDNQNQHELGIIKTTFDILENKDFPIETELFGNAFEYKNNIT